MSYPPPSGFNQNPNPGYPPGPGEGTNYPLNPMAGYPNNPGQNYSPQGGFSPYPPAPGGSPYPQGPGSSPYPQASGGIPYPQAPGGSPYPSVPGSSPYPAAPGGSPYPPPSNQFPVPGNSYPMPGGTPYPPAPSGSPYPASGGSPYPPAPGGGGGYPPSGGSPYPPAGGSFGSSTPYPPSTGEPYGSQPGNSAPGYPPSSSNTYSSQQYKTSTSIPATGSNPQSGYPSSAISGVAGQSSYPSLGSSSISMPVEKVRPTIRPSMSFDPSTDAAALRKAMKGFGTDEKAIIQILGRRSCYQRQEIMMKYQQAYGRKSFLKKSSRKTNERFDLIKDLKSELGGNFENVVLNLMTPLPKFLAKEIKGSISGMGTKESVLIEILCCNENNLIRAIKAAYQELYHVPLEKDIAGDTSGNFKRLLVSCCAAQRDEHLYNPQLAPGLAQSLYKAGEGQWGTNNEEFNRIMASYSHQQLRLVFEEYKNIKGKSFDKAIKSELSGDFEDGMLAIYESCMNRPAYFAGRLRKAMAGAGTKDNDLIRLIVSRSEIDLGTIKEEYARMFGKSLESAVSSETSGDYKKILLALLQD